MIAAHELRIGNWVQHEGNFIKVNGIAYFPNKKDVSGDSKHLSGEFDYGNIEPIHLTPEILENCGFEREGNFGVIKFDPRMKIQFYDFNYAECDIVQDGKLIAFKNSHILHLHQLQNLYFALTGTELNYSPELLKPTNA